MPCDDVILADSILPFKCADVRLPIYYAGEAFSALVVLEPWQVVAVVYCGLSDNNARVGVRPSLAASGAKRGLFDQTVSVADTLTGRDTRPIRLSAPWTTLSISMSCASPISAGLPAQVLPDTMELLTRTAVHRQQEPRAQPPGKLSSNATLNAIVLFSTSVGSLKLMNSIPPWSKSAVLCETVLSIAGSRRRTRGRREPARDCG